MKEVERKFKVSYRPNNLSILKVLRISHTYLATFPEQIRVRRTFDCISGKTNYFLTKKIDGGDYTKEEQEWEIMSDTYDVLLKDHNHRHLAKTRTVAEVDSLIVNFDSYYGEDTIVAEFEFPSEEKADLFVKPDWCLIELDSKDFTINKWEKLNEIKW